MKNRRFIFALCGLIAGFCCSSASMAQTINLSAGKTVTTSSNENTTNTGDKVLDGNMSSRWSSSYNDNQWIRIDLGVPSAISRVVLRWEAAYAKSYLIQTSNDGTTWTTVYTNSLGKGGLEDLPVIANARYIRMNGLTRSSQWGFSLWEFEVYGSKTGGCGKAGTTVYNYCMTGYQADTDGDGWGWENNASCIVPNSSIDPRPGSCKLVGNVVNPLAIPEVKSLKAFMDIHYGKKIISGQYWENYADWVKANTGKTPAILGLDFMDITPVRIQNGANSVDHIAADNWVNVKRGIVTLSFHWDAPTDIYDTAYRAECVNVTGGDARWYKAFYTCATWFNLKTALDAPGSAKYNMLIRDIDTVAEKLQYLEDRNVPVLWRPLHEAEGAWFWWGAQGPDTLKRFWKLMYERLVVTKGLNNLIWVFNSYDYANSKSWYPGPAYVDIISYDYPTAGAWNSYKTNFGSSKIYGLAEVGGLPNPNNLGSEGWSYFVTWADMIQTKNTLDKVKQTYANPNVINLEDLPDLKNYIAP